MTLDEVMNKMYLNLENGTFDAHMLGTLLDHTARLREELYLQHIAYKELMNENRDLRDRVSSR